jgi:hypothetical protein
MWSYNTVRRNGNPRSLKSKQTGSFSLSYTFHSVSVLPKLMSSCLSYSPLVKSRGGQHPEFDDEVRFKIYEETEDILNRPSRSSDTPSVVTDASSSSNPNSNGQGGMARLPLNKSIQVQVWADDSKEPKIVGECSVDLSEVFRTCEQDGEFDEWLSAWIGPGLNPL